MVIYSDILQNTEMTVSFPKSKLPAMPLGTQEPEYLDSWYLAL